MARWRPVPTQQRRQVTVKDPGKGLQVKTIRNAIHHKLAGVSKTDALRIDGWGLPAAAGVRRRGLTGSCSPTPNRLCVVVVRGLSGASFARAAGELPAITSRFSVAYPLKSPGTKTFARDGLTELLFAPLTDAQKKRRAARDAPPGWGAWSGEKPPPPTGEVAAAEPVLDRGMSVEGVLMTKAQLRTEEFPTEAEGCHRLHDEGGGAAQPTLAQCYAVDCEMVMTAAGSKLARCSIIDSSGAVVYDEFVLPDEPVTDYKTQYSGITAELLEGVRTTQVGSSPPHSPTAAHPPPRRRTAAPRLGHCCLPVQCSWVTASTATSELWGCATTGASTRRFFSARAPRPRSARCAI